MRNFLKMTLALALGVAMATTAFAASSTATSTKSKTGAHSTSGTIESYDATAHTLTIKTAKGSTTFNLATDAKVWVGSKSSTADELSKTGAKATVKYTEKEGTKTATSVHVASSTTTK
jgi:hypothetical protein